METANLRRPHLQRLAETLWEERHVVTELLYRLTCARLLLSADQQRFVVHAIDEVDGTTTRLREIELHREGVLEEVAQAAGTDPSELTLALLSTSAPEPWQAVFADHRRAFLSLAAEIEEAATANRELATQALGRVRLSIDTLSGTAPTGATYDAAGRTAPTNVVPLRLDRSL